MTTTDTSCRKCKAPMPVPKNDRFAAMFKVTGFLCACGHWNDLTRRKPKQERAR